jgi:3-deoxy-manno-octulosonate cytidylyltransferase (CMP-KDO synthetase)
MITWKDWLIVVPARLASTRLPRKPLQMLGDKPLVIAVADNLKPLVAKGAEVVIATDSHEILSICQKYQTKAVMTAGHHQSGTDRIAEVAKNSKHPYILNVQGDEPFVSLDDLETLMQAFNQKPDLSYATLVYRNENLHDFINSNVVKAVRASSGFALYFSRAPVPQTRNLPPGASESFWQHIGVYAFKRETLIHFSELQPSPLELTESLEQLRALENHIPIYLAPAKNPSVGIDTPEDLEAAHARLKK